MPRSNVKAPYFQGTGFASTSLKIFSWVHSCYPRKVVCDHATKSDHRTVEDAVNDGDACRKERFAELGTIRIEAYHDRVIGRTGFINDDASYGNLGPVSEKDVKGQAISQSIG